MRCHQAFHLEPLDCLGNTPLESVFLPDMFLHMFQKLHGVWRGDSNPESTQSEKRPQYDFLDFLPAHALTYSSLNRFAACFHVPYIIRSLGLWYMVGLITNMNEGWVEKKHKTRKIKKEGGRLSREAAVFISETCSSPSLRYFFKSLYLIGGASISICVFAKKSGRKNSTVSANYASYDNPFVDVFYVPLFE